MRSALTIAGSDPTGGAGLQADVQVFRAHGLHGAGVVTALTVQDSRRVHQVLPVFPSVLLEQLRCVLADFTPDAVKIGMLGGDDIVRNVILGLATLDERVPVVVDPVLFASDGTYLLERRAYPALRDLLYGRTLVTPNLREAEVLTEIDCSGRKGSEKAARTLLEAHVLGGVLLKGGHRSGDPDDLLCWRDGDDVRVEWLPGKRIGDGSPVHGTGCTLASAITAGLAQGQPLPEAVESGRRYVRLAIEKASAIGRGALFPGIV